MDLRRFTRRRVSFIIAEAIEKYLEDLFKIHNYINNCLYENSIKIKKFQDRFDITTSRLRTEKLFI